MAFHEPPTGTVLEPASGSVRQHAPSVDAALPETTSLREQLAPLANAVDGPLGPPETWDPTLRTAAGICLSSRFPILLWWGPELRMVYNDAYRPMLGSKHPRAFGAPGREVWPEIWHVIGPMLDQVASGGGATWSSDQLLVLERNGYPEECYFTFSYSPVVDPGGEVAGVFCAVTETTDRVLGERRLRTLVAMARLVGSDRRDLVTQRATTVLEANVGDHPLALVADVEPKGPRSALATMLAERLPTVVPETRARLADLLRQAASTGQELRVPTQADPALEHVVAWHAQPVVEPADAGRSVRAVLLLAESSARPWDDGLRSYVQLCATHVAGALAGVHRLDVVRRRTEELAARRAAAARIAEEFTGADDLTDVLATAVSGFGELFGGDVTVRVVVGGAERFFTARGPSDAAGADDAAVLGVGPDTVPPDRPVDSIVLADGPDVGSGQRVRVVFPAARRVGADERVAGDLLFRAFVLACDRVVAASAFADREQHLRRAIASHEAIGQAVGILVERHRWTPAAAFEHLKKVSQDSNTRLREVAERVVESGVDPGSAR